MKRFYFKTFMQKYKESKWISSGQTIAHIYYNKILRKTAFDNLK